MSAPYQLRSNHIKLSTFTTIHAIKYRYGKLSATTVTDIGGRWGGDICGSRGRECRISKPSRESTYTKLHEIAAPNCLYHTKLRSLDRKGLSDYSLLDSYILFIARGMSRQCTIDSGLEMVAVIVRGWNLATRTRSSLKSDQKYCKKIDKQQIEVRNQRIEGRVKKRCFFTRVSSHDVSFRRRAKAPISVVSSHRVTSIP